jgi:hypothetical protein
MREEDYQILPASAPHAFLRHGVILRQVAADASSGPTKTELGSVRSEV